MKPMTVGLVALLVATLAHGQVNPKERFVDERTGIPVIFVTEADMFPESWRGGEIRAHAEPLDGNQVERSQIVLSAALAAYPKELLTTHLKRVYVCKQIDFYGLEYGGTNSLDRVYLTARTAEKGYTDAYIQGSFHHEFSSILLRSHPDLFDPIKWNKSNPVDFHYGEGGTNALRTGKASTKYDGALADKGFLTQYSTASIEEDFNMMVEGLFSGDPEFWNLIDNSKPCREKMKVAIAMYSKLDASFTEQFFRARKVT